MPTFTRCTPLAAFAAVLILGGCLERLDGEFYVAASTSTTTSGSSSGSSSTSNGPGSTSSGGSVEGSGSSSTGASSTGDTTDPSTGSSTGTTPAVCGDGIVGEGEECDDANDEDIDDCDNSCNRAWTIFITSAHDYTGAINGLKGADSRCTNKAGNGGLPDYLSYKALLSDSTTSAAARLHHAKGWYRLVNGLPVAHGWDALMSGPLVNPVNVTEHSETLNYGVWTGTLPGGDAVPEAEHCEDWMSSSPVLRGYYGTSSRVDGGWLYEPIEQVNPTGCGDMQSLYCVEQP